MMDNGVFYVVKGQVLDDVLDTAIEHNGRVHCCPQRPTTDKAARLLPSPLLPRRGLSSLSEGAEGAEDEDPKVARGFRGSIGSGFWDSKMKRHAFDFDAASRAFKNHLKLEGVKFTSEATSPTALRNVFSSSDRRRAASQTTSTLPLRTGRPAVPSSPGYHSSNKADWGWDHLGRPSATQTLHDDKCSLPWLNDVEKEDHPSRSPEKNKDTRNEGEPVMTKSSSYSEEAHETAVAVPSSSTNEAGWSFDRILEEQRRKELQHDIKKKQIFHKVLSILGGNADNSGASQLPSDILRAWEARKENIDREAKNAQKRLQKREEDKALARQRQSLKQRHLPGSIDSAGDDPLAYVSSTELQGEQEGGFEELSHCRPRRCEKGGCDTVTSHQAKVRPVRLELGMDVETLNKILDDIEQESTAPIETNSELSRVLDELDEAAGDNQPITMLTPSAH